jgi:hypothetical protein
MTDNIFARARGSKPAATIQAPPGAIPHTAATTATAPQAPAPTPAAPAVSINGGAPPAPPAAPAAAINAPPWANPLCTACHGVGFNSKGRPCPICDALAKRMKRPTSSMYVIEGDAQSGFTAAVRAENAATLAELSAPAGWSSKADALQFKSSTAAGGGAAPRATTAAEQSAVVVPPAAVQPTVQKAQEAAPTAPAGLVAPATAATVTPPATPTTGTACTVEVLVEPAEVSAKRGRKPAGMTILIGCAQLKGPDRPTESAQALLHRLGAELAKDMGGESYWALDPFKRRDRIKQRAPEIAESLGRTVLLVAGVRDPDVDSLVSSLLPHAEVVVEGLR